MHNMKVLLCHNMYQQYGGEDLVFHNEKEMLHNCNNVDCDDYVLDNSTIKSILDKAKVLCNVSYSKSAQRNFSRALSNVQPDIVHVHNFFPLLSPSVFSACQKYNVPVVHTLHNYRILCPTATLMYKDKVTERSLFSNCYWTVPKRVYRGSLVGSAALAHMVEYNKRIGTWNHAVDRYITLTEFAKNKFVEGGLPEEKISVKPNFILDPYNGIEKFNKQGGFAIFVGRLSNEKGLNVLLDGWRNLNYPLKIIGDGPLSTLVKDFASKHDNVEYCGFQQKKAILSLMQDADFLVMPSVWYEGFPMVLLEAFASGTPALVSNIGGMAEVVDNGVTGLHFENGNAEDLISKVQYLINHKNLLKEMGENARLVYLQKYTPEINHEMLCDIYRETIRIKQGGSIL